MDGDITLILHPGLREGMALLEIEECMSMDIEKRFQDSKKKSKI